MGGKYPKQAHKTKRERKFGRFPGDTLEKEKADRELCAWIRRRLRGKE